MASFSPPWRFLLAAAAVAIAAAMPPADPIQCNTTGCTLSNAYGAWPDRRPCRLSSAAFPTTEDEIRSAVADAVRRGLRVKAVSRFSHTIPRWACPGGATADVLISTERHDKGIDVDAAAMAVTVDAGVGLRVLIDRVEEAELSLGAAPYWEGVSVGGMISTGSHGSSWRGRGGAVHDHMTGLRIVVPATAAEGFAKVVELKGQDPLLKAAKLSLGLLGVISKMTFALEPGFKRSVTLNYTNDNGIEDEYMDHGKKFDFGDIQWYPSKRIAIYRYDDRVPLNVPGDGVYDFVGFQSNLVVASESVRASEKIAENTKSADGKCLLASTSMAYKKVIANGLKNNKLMFTGYPVIGRQGKIQTSGSCLYSPETNKATSCAWDPRIKGLFFYEVTAIFPATKFQYFIKDVKKLRDMNPKSFCGADIYNGFLFRFITKSDAYLGQPEDSVVVDINYYRADNASTPRLNQDVWEEVEQIAFFKYQAKPHWAKNRNIAFTNVTSKYPEFNKFVEAKKALDPIGVFSSEWSNKVFFEKEVVKDDGCALEGSCICSKDRHCSPKNGYLCQAGLVYPEARVCRYTSSSIR